MKIKPLPSFVMKPSELDVKEHTLVIPGTLPGLNEYTAACRGSKYGAAQMKKRVQTDIEWCILKQMKSVRIAQPVTISFRWIEPNQRRDIDNIAFAKKYIIDALVEMKVLRDDGWKYVIGLADSFDIDKDNPRIEVKLTSEVNNDAQNDRLRSNNRVERPD